MKHLHLSRPPKAVLLVLYLLPCLLLAGCGSGSVPPTPTVRLLLPTPVFHTATLANTSTGSPQQTQVAPPPAETGTPSPVLPTDTPPPGATPTPTADPSVPTGRIVFACQLFQDTERDQLCLVNADGSGWQRLTHNDRADYNYASFTPDGDYVLYAGDEGSGFQIYALELATGAVRQLTFGSAQAYAPSSSPDGSQIVYTGNNGSFQALYVIGRDGSNPRHVFGSAAGQAWDPVWAPDGSRILFASQMASGIQLYTIRPDGTDVQQLTNLSGLRGRSDWSPDGSMIATYQGESWQREIILLNAAGGNRQMLTRGGNNLAPSFSPDGNWITFTSYRDHPGVDSGCEIYILRLDGSDLRRLTDNDYCDWQPRWGR